MPLDLFDVSPVAEVPPTEAINGDVHEVKFKDDTQLLKTVPLIVGPETVKTFGDFSFFIRFEPNTPQGAVIAGLKFSMFSNGIAEGVLDRMEGGFIVPQDNFGRNWQLPDGIGLWITSADCMFAEWDTDINQDPAVWHGGAPAFTNETFVIAPNEFDDWALSDGLPGGINTVTGLKEQLQAYMAANEALRGTGNSVDGIPVLFHMHRRWINITEVNQGIFASEQVQIVLRPTLEIDWSPGNTDPVVTITSPPDLITVSDTELVTFIATSIDAQDGDISDGIVWTSNLDGTIGAGASIETSLLSIGTHLITATSTDSGALIGTDSITITVAFLVSDIDAGSNAGARINAKAAVNVKITVTVNADDRIEAKSASDGIMKARADGSPVVS